MELISKREVLRIIEEETIDDEYECEDGSWESYIDFQYADAMKRINDLPTIESRPKGKWKPLCWKPPTEREIRLMFPYKCDTCDKEIRVEHIDDYYYCPHCGADMRGEE